MHRELAAAASRELTVEVPKLLIAAAQPYTTLGGPALSTNFLFQPALLPFQGFSFSHSAMPALYTHTLLHTLAEFAETPRKVRHSHTGQLHAPMADFWKSVGTLNTFYATHHVVQKQHPAMGAVELVRSSHRPERDVKVTLFSEAHKPLVSVLMSGPRGVDEARRSHTGDGDQGSRVPLPPTPMPTADAFHGDEMAVAAQCGTLGGALQYAGGLYGDVVELSDGSSLAHRACMLVSSSSAELSPQMESMAPCVPPWALHACIQDLCNRLSSTQHPSFKGVGGGVKKNDNNSKNSNFVWRLCAHQSVQCGDVLFNSPFEVVCAHPKVDKSCRVSPWRQKLGQPALLGDFPCAALCAEIRQAGAVKQSGTFYFQGTQEESL